MVIVSGNVGVDLVCEACAGNPFWLKVNGQRCYQCGAKGVDRFGFLVRRKVVEAIRGNEFGIRTAIARMVTDRRSPAWFELPADHEIVYAQDALIARLSAKLVTADEALTRCQEENTRLVGQRRGLEALLRAGCAKETRRADP